MSTDKRKNKSKEEQRDNKPERAQRQARKTEDGKEARQSQGCVKRPSVDSLAAAQCWQTVVFQQRVRAVDMTAWY